MRHYWLMVATLAALALSGPSRAERSAEDLARDARDKPQQVMQFAGIEPGMQVVDLFAGGGYYSELLSERVGPAGRVLLYNNPAYAAYGKQGLVQRFTEGRLSNVERRVSDTTAMGLGEASFDRAILVMSLHDLYWVDEKEGWPEIDRDQFLEQVVKALKPGGALLVVDHAAKPGSGFSAVNALHRIDEQFVQSTLQRHGLTLEKTSDILRQPEDDHSQNVFAPPIRGKTDRFVHLYRKSAAAAKASD